MKLSLRNNRLCKGWSEQFQFCRLRGEIPEVKAGGKGCNLLFAHLPLDQCPVSFRHMPPGAQQPMVQFPVAGQQQETRRILIQPAHRHASDAPVYRRQQVHYGGLLCIPRGGQQSSGFIHHHVTHDPPVNVLPVQAEPVFLRFKRKGGIPNDPPVHRGFSATDPFLDLAAAAEGQSRQPPIQPHLHSNDLS